MHGESPVAGPTPSPPPLSGRLLAAVIVGGMLGTAARAGLTELLPHDPAAWPWATFLANLLGAGALGWIAPRTVAAPHLHGLLGTGLCGGLTTFSTLQLEVLRMLDAGASGLAAAYVAASVAGGLALAAALARVSEGRASQSTAGRG